MLAVLPCLSGDLRSATAQSASSQVSITDAGFLPSSSAIGAGDSVHWTNQSTQAQSVTANDGLFDSGPIPPGAGFSMAIAVPGDHRYHSTTNPAVSGVVRLVVMGLVGSAGDLANNRVPNQPFPHDDPADMSMHPRLAVLTSRTHILVTLSASATVAQANAALAAANVAVLGGLPKLGILLVGATDSPDFSGLDAALRSLRANPAVASAAMSMAAEADVVPSAAESGMQASPINWLWQTNPATDWQTQADLGDWGLEASAFPQAWNFLEVIRRKNVVVGTAIVDAGFQGHADLSALTIEQALCKGIIVKDCTQAVAVAHGNHVAGIIGAGFDNPGSSPSLHGSVGVSGANPVAHMHGVPWAFDGATGTDSAALADVFSLLLDAIEAGSMPNVRVINFSVGAGAPNVAMWWAAHPAPTCGPGNHDDGQPGSNQWCTPNNEDEWLNQRANEADDFTRVAQRAAAARVMIVEAAGNEGATFCSSGPTANCPGGFVRTLSTSQAYFAAAARAWPASLPDPVVLVESMGPDLALAGSSNTGGQLDLSAPGVGIWSTGTSTVCSIIPATPTKPEVPIQPTLISGNPYCLLSGTSMAAPQVTALIGYLLAYNPDLGIQEVRNALFNAATIDRAGGASPRINAFASLLSLPGAAKDLVDVNDYSPDGNHRQKLGLNSANQGPDTQFTHDNARGPDGRPYLTDPDGKVDMRDFRRFRDAWLQTCSDSSVAGDPMPPGCPRFTDISLNGLENNPKRDLNFDGCVYVPGDPDQCGTKETAYSRFDFNGDGMVSRTALAPVPLHLDGTPATNSSPGIPMTDLRCSRASGASTLASCRGVRAPPTPRAGPPTS